MRLQANESFMMTSFYSTRVQAPANTTSALTAFDDAVSLNPQGRGTADVANLVDVINPSLSGLLRPKKTITMSTFNVRTLSCDSKVHEPA